MSYSTTRKPYFSAASNPAMAAVSPSVEASSAERAFEEVSMISTRGRLFCTQARHWANACGCANSFLICVFRELLSRSEEHTSELQSQSNLVCRLLLEKKKKRNNTDK